MITADKLLEGFGLNLRLILRQTDGLSHADSLIQTPFNVNCLNWVLGHIAVNRDNLLRLMGGNLVLSASAYHRYESGSEPVKQDGKGVVHLDQLLGILNEGQTRISAAVEKLTASDLENEIQVGDANMTVINRMFGFYFHDTYHTGQTEILRQVAGMNDRIV